MFHRRFVMLIWGCSKTRCTHETSLSDDIFPPSLHWFSIGFAFDKANFQKTHLKAAWTPLQLVFGSDKSKEIIQHLKQLMTRSRYFSVSLKLDVHGFACSRFFLIHSLKILSGFGKSLEKIDCSKPKWARRPVLKAVSNSLELVLIKKKKNQ